LFFNVERLAPVNIDKVRDDWFEGFDVKFCHFALRITLDGRDTFRQLFCLPDCGAAAIYYKNLSTLLFQTYESDIFTISGPDTSYGNVPIEPDIWTNSVRGYLGLASRDPAVNWDADEKEIPRGERPSSDESARRYCEIVRSCFPHLAGSQLHASTARHSTDIVAGGSARFGFAVSMYYILANDGDPDNAALDLLHARILQRSTLELSAELLTKIAKLNDVLSFERAKAQRDADAFIEIRTKYDQIGTAIESLASLRNAVSKVMRGRNSILWSREFFQHSVVPGLFQVKEYTWESASQLIADCGIKINLGHDFGDYLDSHFEDQNSAPVEDLLRVIAMVYMGIEHQDIAEAIKNQTVPDAADEFLRFIFEMIEENKCNYEALWQIYYLFKSGCADVANPTNNAKREATRYGFLMPALLVWPRKELLFPVDANGVSSLPSQNMCQQGRVELPIDTIEVGSLLTFLFYLFKEMSDKRVLAIDKFAFTSNQSVEYRFQKFEEFDTDAFYDAIGFKKKVNRREGNLSIARQELLEGKSLQGILWPQICAEFVTISIGLTSN
jgi:hypothetical protein